jgi:hypothetical protein
MSQPRYTVVTEAKRLAEYARKIAEGHYNAIAIIGPGGCGKSTIFEAALPPYDDQDQGPAQVLSERFSPVIVGFDDRTKAEIPWYGGVPRFTKSSQGVVSRAHWIKGMVSPIQFYIELARNIDRTIVADDCHNFFGNPRFSPLLKQICETNPIKTCAWGTLNATLRKEGIDQSFKTRSRVVLIGNEWKAIGRDGNAIVTRLQWLRYVPSNEELFRHAKTWFDDEEILGYVHACIKGGKVRELNLRVFRQAHEHKLCGLEDWRRWLDDQFLSSDPNDELLPDPQAILRWMDNQEKQTFTSNEVYRALPRFREKRDRLRHALEWLVKHARIHVIPRPEREPGQVGRPPNDLYGRGPGG